MSQPVTTVALTVLAGGAAWWLTKVSADEPRPEDKPPEIPAETAEASPQGPETSKEGEE